MTNIALPSLPVESLPSATLDSAASLLYQVHGTTDPVPCTDTTITTKQDIAKKTQRRSMP